MPGHTGGFDNNNHNSTQSPPFPNASYATAQPLYQRTRANSYNRAVNNLNNINSNNGSGNNGDNNSSNLSPAAPPPLPSSSKPRYPNNNVQKEEFQNNVNYYNNSDPSQGTTSHFSHHNDYPPRNENPAPSQQYYPSYQQSSSQQQHYTQAEDSLRQNIQHYQLNDNNNSIQHNPNNNGSGYQPNQNRFPRQKKPVLGQTGASAADHEEKDQHPSTYYPQQPNKSPKSTSQSTAAATDATPTLRERIRRLYRFPCSTNGKALLALIGIEAAIVIAMQAAVVGLYFEDLIKAPAPGSQVAPYLDQNNVSRSVPAYLIVFVFAQLFQWVMTWDAVRAQNTIELIGVVVFNLCCLAYSIFEISQIWTSLKESADLGFFGSMDVYNAVKPYLIVVVAVLAVTQILCTWFAYQLFQEFGWKIYKKIGADPVMKKMYRAYQIYLVLIKVDLFFFVGFSIQFIYLTLTKRAEDPEYWITIFVLPATLLILWLAVYSVRHESRKGMSLFLISMVCGVVYCVFKVVRMYYGPKKDNFYGVKKFLTLFAALCLVTLLLTIVNAVICFRNFGKGLKTHLMRDNRETQDVTSPSNGRVLEID
ncbi:hypothetical protein BGZ83_006006 [Gryganskiella cystojenkinii]|nr:hypothetical protein BGZ83_006006 [Gryganskiella cystojenkinii]